MNLALVLVQIARHLVPVESSLSIKEGFLKNRGFDIYIYIYIYILVLHHTLGVITQSSISDTCWLQATLPIRLGGLGFRETLTSSSAAFLGSCHSNRQIIVRLLHQGTASPPPSTLRISGE